MSLFRQKKATGNWFIDHSLSIVLLGILVFQLVILLTTGPELFAAEELAIPYWTWFIHEYTMSTIADTYGVVLIVILSKFLYERGSSESNDTPDEKKLNSGDKDSIPQE